MWKVCGGQEMKIILDLTKSQIGMLRAVLNTYPEFPEGQGAVKRENDTLNRMRNKILEVLP